MKTSYHRVFKQGYLFESYTSNGEGVCIVSKNKISMGYYERQTQAAATVAAELKFLK